MRPARVVLDTNVILSALLCGGNPAEYFALSLAGTIELFASHFIIDELVRILRNKFRWKPQQIRDVRKWYCSIATILDPRITLEVVKRNPADNHILECAVAAAADFLVTGDKRDLLPLKTVRGVRIVSPIEGLALLAGA